jgi:hypothetical protein
MSRYDIDEIEFNKYTEFDDIKDYVLSLATIQIFLLNRIH